MHLTGTLLPPAIHGTKISVPQLIDYITSAGSDALKSHRAAQAAAALSKIHQLKKNQVSPHSLGLLQIVELQRKHQQQQRPQSGDVGDGQSVDSQTGVPAAKDQFEQSAVDLDSEVFAWCYLHMVSLLFSSCCSEIALKLLLNCSQTRTAPKLL